MDYENDIEKKSRTLKRQSHEELLYKNLYAYFSSSSPFYVLTFTRNRFAQSLKLQKQRVIEERKDSRERKEEYDRQCAIKQQSIEN